MLFKVYSFDFGKICCFILIFLEFDNPSQISNRLLVFPSLKLNEWPIDLVG